jgi:hypothetical protein
MSYIFISYSGKNLEYTRTLVQKLLDLGFDVWFDEHIHYGENWLAAIETAIQNCTALIVVMTPDSKTSKWVQGEIQLADDLNKTQYPILLEGDTWLQYRSTQIVQNDPSGLPPERFFIHLTETYAATGTGRIVNANIAKPKALPLTKQLDSKPVSRSTRLVFAVAVLMLLVAIGIWRLGFSTPTKPTYHIVPEESEVIISIGYTLYDIPTTIYARTRSLSGTVQLELAKPANTILGEIKADASTLTTDSTTSLEDTLLRSVILQSKSGEPNYVIFSPTKLTGLPTSPVKVGDTWNFQVTGNFTVQTVTNSTIVDVEVTILDKDRIHGTAKTRLRYSEFGLEIPPLPAIIPDDEIEVQIDFIAILGQN